MLVAEQLDYNIEDFLGDDEVFVNPEGHSIGIIQERIDRLREWNIMGWNPQTPASEIRSALLDPQQAVQILAKVLRYHYEQAPADLRRRLELDGYDQQTDAKRLMTARLFVGAKDKGFLTNLGSLTGAANSAFEYVRSTHS